MSSVKKNVEDKYSQEYWDNFANDTKQFITAKQITKYIVCIALVVQLIAQFITPSSWLIYQLLAFIMATNLGAVLLAIHAQKSADIIRESYSAAFNGDFYHTLYLLSGFKRAINKAAEEESSTVKEEVDAVGGDIYGVFKGYLKAFNEDMNVEETHLTIKEVEYKSNDDLFN